MPDFLANPFADGPLVDPWQVFVRLLAALALGFLVAWIYRRTGRNPEMGPSFPLTLVLLAVLIAMVTQVIGDNIARAFSLVGALSIVRFRTVVRDTRDTAFVIFSVVIGMAVGARNLWVAVIGLCIVGSAAFFAASRAKTAGHLISYLLVARLNLGADVEPLLARKLDAIVSERRVMCVQTAKQGTSLEVTYEFRMRASISSEALVRELNGIDGVQDVRLHRRGFEPG
jgi:hypothetical protein